MLKEIKIFLISIFLQPNGLNLRYFKFRLFDPTEMMLGNIRLN